MSVILEFSIRNDQFTLGKVLSGSPPMNIELERVVPTGDAVMPFLWVTGDEFGAFEEKVLSSEYVEDLFAIDSVEDSVLYRVTWHGDQNDVIGGVTEAEGTVLEAHSNDDWTFRIRFNDHDRLSQFHNYCTERGLPIHIIRTYTFTERTDSVRQFGLTGEQRKALVLALRNGYFETPSEISLDELADELGISQQAVSNRIRRGERKILTEAMLSSAEDLR